MEPVILRALSHGTHVSSPVISPIKRKRFILFLENNVWRKKYIEERKRTGQIEEQIKKIRGAIEKQHQKLMSSSASPKGAINRDFRQISLLILTQPTFTCSKLTVEILEQRVKYGKN